MRAVDSSGQVFNALLRTHSFMLLDGTQIIRAAGQTDYSP